MESPQRTRRPNTTLTHETVVANALVRIAPQKGQHYHLESLRGREFYWRCPRFFDVCNLVEYRSGSTRGKLLFQFFDNDEFVQRGGVFVRHWILRIFRVPKLVLLIVRFQRLRSKSRRSSLSWRILLVENFWALKTKRTARGMLPLLAARLTWSTGDSCWRKKT